MKKITTILTATLCAASLSQAATLATFSFTGGSLVEDSANTFVSDVVLGASWSAIAVDGVLDQDSATSTTITTDAVNLVTFTYTVNGLGAGETLDITSASLDFTGTANTVRFNFTTFALAGSTANTNPPGSGTFTETTDSFLGLVNGDVVTVSFGSRDNGANNTQIDNLQLFGDVVVPEPSSTALLGLGGVALLLRRRKA